MQALSVDVEACVRATLLEHLPELAQRASVEELYQCLVAAAGDGEDLNVVRLSLESAREVHLQLLQRDEIKAQGWEER